MYFNYSENGGASWLPANWAIVVNDTATVGTEGRTSAFPSMVVDQRDNIYIAYVRGSSALGGGSDDVMLAKVDRATNPFIIEQLGPTGTAGSAGGVRITDDGTRQNGPDLAVGTGDVLHLLYFDDATDRIEHKSLIADAWSRAGATGWDQGNPGALVDDFDNSANPAGALETDARFFFPTVAVDKQSSPDKIYAVYKFGDANYETVFFNSYVYDNAIGGAAGWNDAQAAPVWSTAVTPVFDDGGTYNIELEWTVTEPVSVVVDDRLPARGDLHIAFTAGATGGAGEHDIYYGYYNGSSWTLPEKVADDDSDGTDSEDGIDNADTYLSAPVLAKYADSHNLYLAFVGGTGEGLGVDGVSDVDQHPYFKVLGRDITYEDASVPVGAYQYDLSYTPVNPQSLSVEIENNLVYVHVPDNADGTGLGATGHRNTDGFLTGNWDRVGTTLADDDKYFDGLIDEDNTSINEWGDDDDKIGLLVKLNVLGSNSTTNVQVVTNSTASAAGTGEGARTVRVGTNPKGTFVVSGNFFALGADIDIVDANTTPVVDITEPDGTGDRASTAYPIQYSLTDSDDDISATGDLLAALYFSADSSLASVQDIRIFGTLIADENDNSSVFSGGTNDFQKGSNQIYSWDDPSTALKGKLFASIFQVPPGEYYIYLVADDQKNPPVFARSPGALTIKHAPLIDFVAPVGRDTIDTGVRSGGKANPYDLDFKVRDFDDQGTTQVQLFYASFSGLSSVSVSGTYPNLGFALGKSVAGIRAIPITFADTLTSADVEFSWDLTDSVDVGPGPVVDWQNVAEGTYYIYAVASDSDTVVVGQSQMQLTVKHSPAFTFYEPAKDTHRSINTGSQPIYTVQWQKGPGDQDFDDDASIDLYFTTDNPATINYENYPDSLLKDADTRIIITGLTEDDDGRDDMYVWDLRAPANDVPRENRKVWLYAVISDDHNNRTVALGGALTMDHDPRIDLLSSNLSDYGSFVEYDVLRITWDDYLVDDGSGTDDAYIRLYASTDDTYTTLDELETEVGLSNAFLINSSDGTLNGTIQTIREDSSNFFDWNTRLFGSAAAYSVYAAISKDATFNNNTASTLSRSVTQLTIAAGVSKPNVILSPTDIVVARGDTLTLDVMVYYTIPIKLVQIVLQLNDNSFDVINPSAPFTDLGLVFPGTTPIENTYKESAKQLRFVKATFLGQLVGTANEPVPLARFQLAATGDLGNPPQVVFSDGETGTVIGVVGRNDPIEDGEDSFNFDETPLDFKRILRGQIEAYVELEGRTLGPDDYATLLDVHLRVPGSTIDIADSVFTLANDDYLTTADTVEVETNGADGFLTLVSVPPGRYVLTVKDTSHVSGRTDTFMVTNGETVQINPDPGTKIGFYGSDLRGDPTTLLGGTASGRELVAGDVSQDNEINEDDVNLIIAVWAGGPTGPGIPEADISNDLSVGPADLTLTTSNFGNSEAFGAPPVYKPVGRIDNLATRLEIHPLFDARQPVWPGREVEFAVETRELDDLAGYEFELHFDPTALRLLPAGVDEGDIFADNPHGAVFESRYREGEVAVIGARIGKRWSARGDGTLARLRFEVIDERGLESLQPGTGALLTSTYGRRSIRWGRSLAELLLPNQISLDPNYPNPFNPSTVIPFALPVSGRVDLEIFNILGQKVRTLMSGPLDAGYHTLVWNGRDDAGQQVATGMYLYLLESGDFRQTRKMTLVK